MDSYKHAALRGKTSLETSKAAASLSEALHAAAKDAAAKQQAMVLMKAREMQPAIKGSAQAALREAEDLSLAHEAEDPVKCYEDEEEEQWEDEEDEEEQWEDEEDEDEREDHYICPSRRRRRGHRARCSRSFMGPRNAYDGRRA